jgi:hypothetical protein
VERGVERNVILLGIEQARRKAEQCQKQKAKQSRHAKLITLQKAGNRTK